MSVQIIKRVDGQKSKIETIDRIRNDAPQISYSSEGRIAVRIPQDGGDSLIVFDRPLSKELIRFIKNGISEDKPLTQFDHITKNYENLAKELVQSYYSDDNPYEWKTPDNQLFETFGKAVSHTVEWLNQSEENTR